MDKNTETKLPHSSGVCRRLRGSKRDQSRKPRMESKWTGSQKDSGRAADEWQGMSEGKNLCFWHHFAIRCHPFAICCHPPADPFDILVPSVCYPFAIRLLSFCDAVPLLSVCYPERGGRGVMSYSSRRHLSNICQPKQLSAWIQMWADLTDNSEKNLSSCEISLGICSDGMWHCYNKCSERCMEV